MIQLRLYDYGRDYPILADWWTRHGWEPVIPGILPKTGAVIYDVKDGVSTDVCAGFLYMDNSTGFSMMEWVVANPDVTGMLVARGIKVLVDFLKQCAVDNDYGVMMTSSNQPSLVRLYARAGFATADTGVTHMLMFTKPGAPAMSFKK